MKTSFVVAATVATNLIQTAVCYANQEDTVNQNNTINIPLIADTNGTLAEIECGSFENKIITFVLSQKAQGEHATLSLKRPFPGNPIFEAKLKSFVTDDHQKIRVTTFEFLPEQQTCTTDEQGETKALCAPTLQRVELTDIVIPGKRYEQNVEVTLNWGKKHRIFKYENCHVDMRRPPKLDKLLPCGISAYKDRGDGLLVRFRGWRPDGEGCL